MEDIPDHLVRHIIAGRQRSQRFAYSALATAHDLLGQPDTAHHWRRRALAAAETAEDHANVIDSRVQELIQVLTYHAERVIERRAIAMAAVAAVESFGARRGGDVPVRPELIDVHLDYIEGRWDRARTPARC